MLFDRPPRISSRFSDCKMPLDLLDDDLFATEGNQEHHLGSKVTVDGWSRESKYSVATWARLRYIIGRTREEIFEYKFLPQSTEKITKLK